ncbi:hypothetical protein AG1IA_05727 [Rhizoctonia solani AG-1 IA]|uniref:Uncharacterized protein n=1 Tax=Thanatephorus cucumeris (strain AG1-IA) TaxID=983506 RepID=L8WU01_THACA|nr:hypothetical protein AG1IA_05727 [Rhizoctonia solani AG-1 IA]
MSIHRYTERGALIKQLIILFLYSSASRQLQQRSI